MKESLTTLCQQFTKAQNIIAEAEPLQSRFAYPICAEMFVEHGVIPDIKTLRECDHIILKEAGLFSDFSGMTALMIISHLAMTDDPLKAFSELDQARKVLRMYFPHASEYVSMASIVLTETTDAGQWDAIAQKAKHIYDVIKTKHRILTSGGDIVFSVILARSTLDFQTISNAADKSFKLLAENGFDTQSRLSLSRVLALSGDTPENSCQRFQDLYQALLKKGYKYGREYQLPVLGLCIARPGTVEEIADDIISVDDYLSKQKPYKGVVPIYSKTVRLMHAAMIISGQSQNHQQNALIALEVTIWSLFDILFI